MLGRCRRHSNSIDFLKIVVDSIITHQRHRRRSHDTLIMSNISRTVSTSLRPIARAALAPRPVQTRCLSFLACRQHEAQIRIRRDAIRQRIRDLETSRRKFSVSSSQRHGHLDKPNPGEEYVSVYLKCRKEADGRYFRLHVTFVDKDGDEHEFEVAKGDNLLDIAQANDLEMEGE